MAVSAGGVLGAQLQIGQRQGQGFAHGRIVFSFETLLQKRELLRLTAALQTLGGAQALRRVVGEQLVAGQRRGPGLVGRAAALGGVAMATEWLVVAWAQKPAGMAAGELALMAEPAAGDDRGRGDRGQTAGESHGVGPGHRSITESK